MMEFHSRIESTLLRPTATTSEVRELCREAMELGFFGVCVNPWFVTMAHHELRGSSVKCVTVIGFPLGANASRIKAIEAQEAISDGADELDMVLALGLLKEKRFSEVEQDIAGVVAASGARPVKVIIETALLTESEKVDACKIAAAAGAKFVKTCTGFGGGGATTADIALMRSVVPASVGVKASGGIKSAEIAAELVRAGADRVGTSSGKLIVGGVSRA